MRIHKLLLAGALAALGFAPVAADSPFRVGERLPGWVLPTLDGGEMSPADLHGKKTVLHVFASW